MDDSYELISKQHLKKLKEENANLKQELDNLKLKLLNNKENNKPVTLDKEVLYEIEQISKKERETIISYLEQIKELNEKNLDRTLTRTEILDKKLESLAETMKDLVINLEEVIKEVPSQRQEEIDLLKELKTNIIKFHSDPEIAQIQAKLLQIEDFMTKLKILLSQIKPGDMRLN
jgi:DNA primase catalytic subunit